MAKIPPTPKAVPPPVRRHGPDGDVLVGHTFDEFGNKMTVLQVNTSRAQTNILLTQMEKQNLIKALTDEPETEPEEAAAAQARSRLWTPPGA